MPINPRVTFAADAHGTTLSSSHFVGDTDLGRVMPRNPKRRLVAHSELAKDTPRDSSHLPKGWRNLPGRCLVRLAQPTQNLPTALAALVRSFVTNLRNRTQNLPDLLRIDDVSAQLHLFLDKRVMLTSSVVA